MTVESYETECSPDEFLKILTGNLCGLLEFMSNEKDHAKYPQTSLAMFAIYESDVRAALAALHNKVEYLPVGTFNARAVAKLQGAA